MNYPLLFATICAGKGQSYLSSRYSIVSCKIFGKTWFHRGGDLGYKYFSYGVVVHIIRILGRTKSPFAEYGTRVVIHKVTAWSSKTYLRASSANQLALRLSSIKINK